MRNRNFIAETTLGSCPLCDLLMDVGEWVSQRASGRLVHLGCTSRSAAEPTTQFRLFGDNEIETAIEAKDETIERAKETLGIKHISFDGASVLGVDVPRLAGQLATIFNLMRDGKFRTLAQIAGAAECLETSASARLRDFRKARFGSHTVVSRPVESVALVYEYRLIINERKETDERRNAA